MKPVLKTNTIIIGASAAGLASAACLKEKNLPYILIERKSQVAQAWRNHYDRLHLHTNKNNSALPFQKMPPHYPKYPKRDQVVEYLENYAKSLDLNPVFNQTVISATKSEDVWEVKTQDSFYESQNVIIGTGYTDKPFTPKWIGKENFEGTIIHSSQYKNGKEYKDKHVLVVGFGNSACEIAMDLHENGAKPFMSVRNAVNIIPRDLLGIPILSIGIVMGILPYKFADKMNAPILKAVTGDFTKYGLRKLPYGPIEQIHRHHQIPLLDIGTLKLIKQGHIKILPDISELDQKNILFTNGVNIQFDCIVSGTGWKVGYPDFLQADGLKTIQRDLPEKSGTESNIKGLYFCGFFISPTGMIREIGIEAKQIAKEILEKSK